MVEKTHGFSSNEVVDLYHYLCIYENEIQYIGNQEKLVKTYPKLQELEKTMSHFVCNYCSRESLKVIALAPMNNLVSMTKCRSSKPLSFLHHLRNSIAHGQIEMEDNYVHLIDYGYEKNVKVFSARGKIESSILLEIIKTVIDNIKLS